MQIQRERKQNRHYQETEGLVSGEKLPPSKIRKWLAPTSRYPGWLTRGGTWVYEKSGPWGLASMQKWAESRHTSLAPSQVQNVNKKCPVCQEEKQRMQIVLG